MNTDRVRSAASGLFLGSGLRNMLIMWAVMVGVGYAYFTFIEQKQATVRDDLKTTQSSVDRLSQRVEEGNPAVASELNSLQEEFRQISDQVESYGRTLGTYDERFGKLSDQMSRADSERAVARAKTAELAAEVATIRRNLSKLKTLEAEWQAQRASLMTGEAGRRIASSPAHLELVLGAFDRKETTAETISTWETQVEALAAPLDRASAQGAIALVPEHQPMLAELGSRIGAALSVLEQQSLQVMAVLKATTGVTPGAETLEEALVEHRVRAAIRESEEQSRALAQERATTAEVIRAAEIEKERKLREATEAAIKANADVELKKIEDAIAAVRLEEEKRQAEFQARVERERAEARFRQALPELRRYLVPFITPGNRHIAKGEWTYTEDKKPLSLSAIRADGALENSSSGHQRFYHLASGARNDRPNGIYRGNYFGGAIRSELVPDVVKAQNLLQTYGEMLVEKGMLEP